MDNRQAIMREVAALSSHFPVSTKSPADHARWLEDYADDLGDAGFEAVAEACRDWRRAGNKRMPNPGQLLPIVRKVRDVARLISGPRPEPWRELTDEEYEALPMRAKIRHRTILAHQARDKAGPMWLKGKPAGPDELPPRWLNWTTVARGHEAEIGRLTRKLLEATGADA